MTQTPPNALLYVLASPGDKVSTEEFNAWYDDEHAPNRTTVPGVQTALRYVADDDKTPSWLAVYDLDNAAVLSRPAYTNLWSTSSAREKDILSRMQTLHRRVYTHISTYTAPDYAPERRKFLLCVGLEPAADSDLTDEEFNRFYEEDHLPILAKGPGFLRATRWKLEDAKGQEGVTRYMALYELEEEGMAFVNSQATKDSMSTEWWLRLGPKLSEVRELRTFKLHKTFK